MTREERYKRLDEKRPLKYGSHRESLLRYERYVKKYNSMVKKLPGDKDIDEVIDIFLETATRGSFIEDSECKIVICKVNDFQLNLSKGYTYELVKDNPKIKIEREIGFYSLNDFLFATSCAYDLCDRLDDLSEKALDWWVDYIKEENNEEYYRKFDSKKSIGEYVREISDKFSDKFMNIFGLDLFNIGTRFHRRNWIIKEVLGDQCLKFELVNQDEIE